MLPEGEKVRRTSGAEARVLRAAAILSVGACQPDPGLETWVGAHLEYRSSPLLQVCGGTHRLSDEFIPFIASELDIPIPSGISYTWLDQILDAKCPGETWGCARGSTAFSETPLLPHELVHLVGGLNGMSAWPFFAEGLAVAYDPWRGAGFGPRYVRVPGDNEPLPDPRLFLTLPADEFFYFTAGSFVAFLLARHGPEPFVKMTRALPEERNLELLRKIFRDAYSTELDQEAELFMAGPDCMGEPFPTLVYDCVMPEVDWSTSTVWSYRRTLDCADDDVAGGYKPTKAFPSVHSVTLDVPTAGTYLFQVSSDHDITVQLGACFGCPWERREVWVSKGKSVPVELDVGPYYLRIVGRSDESPEVQIDLIHP